MKFTIMRCLKNQIVLTRLSVKHKILYKSVYYSSHITGQFDQNRRKCGKLLKMIKLNRISNEPQIHMFRLGHVQAGLQFDFIAICQIKYHDSSLLSKKGHQYL